MWELKIIMTEALRLRPTMISHEHVPIELIDIFGAMQQTMNHTLKHKLSIPLTTKEKAQT